MQAQIFIHSYASYMSPEHAIVSAKLSITIHIITGVTFSLIIGCYHCDATRAINYLGLLID